MIRLNLYFLVCAVIVTLTGCGDRHVDHLSADTAGPDVVAIYEGGSVTIRDIDTAILDLPDGQRPSGDDLTIERYKELIRFLVAERLLIRTASAESLEFDPRLADELARGQRRILVQAYTRMNLPAITPPTDAELRAEYEATADLYRRDEKRLVTHLFIRRAPGDSPEKNRGEIAALRQRAMAGEKLSLLAREHSDSESRHQDGNLGWIELGAFPPELENIIFGLDEGELSDPVVTREGVHLFKVEKSVEAKVFEFEEVRETIARRWMEKRSREATERMANALPAVDELWIADPDDLQSLVERGDPQAAILRNGDFEVSVGRFSQLLYQARQGSNLNDDPHDLPRQLLEDLKRFEKIYAAAEFTGLADDELVAANLDRLERSILVKHARHEALVQLLAQRLDLTEQYFKQNELRFSSPLRLLLRRIQVPIEKDRANQVMAELEQAADRVEGTAVSTQPTLDILADRFGVTVEDLGWKTVDEIARSHPVAATTVVNSRPGSLTPPFQIDGFLVVLEVVERREPEPRPLSTVLDDVQNAYLSDHENELFRTWMDNALEEVDLVIIEANVATLSDDRSRSRNDNGG